MRYKIKERTGINQADISKLENGTLNKMKIFQFLIHNKTNQKTIVKIYDCFFAHLYQISLPMYVGIHIAAIWQRQK